MAAYWPPGVSRESVRSPAPAQFRTGVPAFVGYAAARPDAPASARPPRADEPPELRSWAHFQELYGAAVTGLPVEDWTAGFLAAAVRGFFRNGGRVCRIVALDPGELSAPPEVLAARHAALHGAALAAVDRLDDVDLLCLPDLMLPMAALLGRARAAGAAPDPARLAAAEEDARTLQEAALAFCGRRGDVFAVLDAPPGAGTAQVNAHAAWLGGGEGAVDGALYYPWVHLPEEAGASAGPCPPCGHVAGVYAASDETVGVHKAPANVALDGVVDLERPLSETEHRAIRPEVNCLRAFPGRGVRVWGARTLGGAAEPAWTYVPVRRLFHTVARWISQFLTAVTFEPNAQALWSRITREATSFLNGLHRRGALLGATPQEAFYVRCDTSTNPPELAALGHVVTEIGLAAGAPNEFIAVRVTHTAGGTTITGPNPA